MVATKRIRSDFSGHLTFSGAIFLLGFRSPSLYVRDDLTPFSRVLWGTTKSNPISKKPRSLEASLSYTFLL